MMIRLTLTSPSPFRLIRMTICIAMWSYHLSLECIYLLKWNKDSEAYQSSSFFTAVTVSTCHSMVKPSKSGAACT